MKYENNGGEMIRGKTKRISVNEWVRRYKTYLREKRKDIHLP